MFYIIAVGFLVIVMVALLITRKKGPAPKKGGGSVRKYNDNGKVDDTFNEGGGAPI
jgi:hypothetical protein